MGICCVVFVSLLTLIEFQTKLLGLDQSMFDKLKFIVVLWMYNELSSQYTVSTYEPTG